MMKKIMVVLIAAVFACSSLLFMASCAKKHVKVEEGAVKPAPEKGAAVEEKKGVDEEQRKREAERQTRLREQARAEKLQSEIRAFEAGNVYFDFDRSELKPKARAILKKKADWLRRHPGFSVRIEGHCDERGTNEYNLALGERRANAALKFINALGISGDRISTISYGEERPVDSGHNEEAWWQNRRDDFKLTK